MQRNKNEALEARLEEWGDWFRKGNKTMLGYPSETIEYRLLRDGMLIKTKFGIRSEPTNESAEEVDKWVRNLHLHDENLSDAIRLRYLIMPNDPIHIISLKKKIRMRTLEDRLRLAKTWLSGCMSISRNNIRK